jgi:hypothetical protein
LRYQLFRAIPQLHFHPFCFLISAIHSFAFDANLTAIYLYFSVTYLAYSGVQLQNLGGRWIERCHPNPGVVNQGG